MLVRKSVKKSDGPATEPSRNVLPGGKVEAESLPVGEFNPETDSVIDIDDGVEAEPTRETAGDFTISLQHRHAEWVIARAAAERRTPENLIERLIREAWVNDPARIGGGSVLVGSKAEQALKD